MNLRTFVGLFVALSVSAATAQAQTSTLRVHCSGAAVGSAVSFDGRFKAECPFDATVQAGTIVVRATKQINGREAVFEERVRMGAGIAKRVEIQFEAGETAAPQVPVVDPKEAARRRYQIEMQEWERNMAACRPKHAEYLAAKAREARLLQQECIALSNRFYEEPGRGRCTCAPNIGTSEICLAMNEATEQSEATWAADTWCGKQFTKPTAPL